MLGEIGIWTLMVVWWNIGVGGGDLNWYLNGDDGRN